VETLIAGVPVLVARRTLTVQESTNIIGFLENTAQVVDCSTMPTTVVLISDGIEQSEYVSLTEPSAKLPPPSPMFAGCEELQILGLGQGTQSPTFTAHLRDEWARWAAQAGFIAFTGLNDW
jgi:hypothetical protein